MDSRYFRYFDWMSFFLIVILCCISISFVFSATYKPTIPYSSFFIKQVCGILSGFVIYFGFCLCDYRILARLGYLGYLSVIALLIFTLVKGKIGMGGQRWISLGLFAFQPSELAKLFLPSFITHFIYQKADTQVYEFKDFVPLMLIIGFSFLLIRKQPDLGTALLILFSAGILLWISGLSNKFFLCAFFLTLSCTPILWHFLKPYQKQRILVFIGEGSNFKERYQIEQSKIAIGSGGISGKGLLQGTQNTLRFLPENRTDFIFSVICEEWGLRGAFLIIILYILLLCRLLYMVTTIKDFCNQILALGLIIHIAFSCVINIGMVLGLLPIVGIPLPLISYGITHIWITLASLGWLQSIAIRRFYISG